MNDSDEDIDMRRSRDKFRRERSDVDSRREKREPFDDRMGGGRPGTPRSRQDRRQSDFRPYGVQRDRPSFGNDMQNKRPRRDWNDNNRSPYRSRDTRRDQIEDEGNYRPPLMPFKRFLEPLDDFITDVEAMAKYKEYKEAHNKRYIEEFFEAHKNEEWLREKYHPDFMDETREQVARNIRQRLDVFLDLFDKGMIDNQPVDVDNTKNLVKLMDAVVIKLNGGTDEDLAVLDKPEEPIKMGQDDDAHALPASPKRKRARTESMRSDGEESDIYSDEDVPSKETPSTGQKAVANKPDNDWTGVSSDSDTEKPLPDDAKVEKEDQEEEEDYGGDLRDSDNEEKPPPKKSPVKPEVAGNDESIHSADEVEERGNDEANKNSNADTATANGGIQDPPSSEHEPAPARQASKYPLHKTASIFFRCLPPTITRKELTEACASQPGFLRLAIYDPMPERGFTRHAWATYAPTVNAKQVCWALNTHPLLQKTSSGGATVNRELAQRVRPVSGLLTRHRPVARNDLRVASRLVAQLDARHSLWPAEEEAGAVTSACPVPGLPGVLSANPLMRNLTDFLVDETSSEEAAILNRNTNDDGGNNATEGDDEAGDKSALDTDELLLRALDRLIIYLRVVYSIDYYAATLYQLEDLMPHRCGILHARAPLPTDPTTIEGAPTVSLAEVNAYIRNFNEKIAHLVEMPHDLTDEEIKALGARDPEKAAEDFIEANIQKRTSKKKPCKVVWVCPLSDKKFREPVFVRKHILNKHMEKVEAAKKDNAIFFNNFLRDPKRPSLPDAPRHLINRYYPPPAAAASGMGGPDAPGHPRSNYRNSGGGGYRGRGGFNRNSAPYGRRDFYGGGGDGNHHGNNYGDFPGRLNSPRGAYRDFGNRKRPYPGDAPRPGGRGVVSYNDLDDPSNSAF